MARKFKRRFPKRKFYRINQYIQAREVRVVDEKGKQIGILSLNEALKQAQEKRLDLVEVAPKAQPPVCKIIDFKKFRYLESKKTQEERKKSKKVELKEIRLRPFIAAGDFNFRIRRAEEFLKEGHRVKLSVFFKGREITKKEFGSDVLKRAFGKLSAWGKEEGEPKSVGRRLELTLVSVAGGKNVQGQKEKVKNKKVSRQKI